MNPEVVSYIKGELDRGVLKDAVREALLQAGWDPLTVDGSFAHLESHANITERVSKLINGEKQRPGSLGAAQGVVLRREPSSPLFVTKELPASVSHFVGGEINHEHQQKLVEESDKTFSSSHPVLMPSQLSVSASREGGRSDIPTSALLQKPRRFNRRIVEAVVGGFLVAGVAAGGYFGWQYYEEQAVPGRLLAAMPEKMTNLKSLRYTAKLHFKTSPDKSTLSDGGDGVRTLPLADLLRGVSAADVIQVFGFKKPVAYMPGSMDAPSLLPYELQDADIEIRSSGIYQQAGDHSNFSAELSFNVEQGRQNIGLGGELRYIDDMYYVRLTQLPIELISPAMALSPFGVFDVTRIVRNWYSLKTATLAEFKIAPRSDDRDKEREQALGNELKTLYAKSALFDIVSSQKEGSGDHATYRYVLEAKPDQLMQFMKAVTELAEDRGLTRAEELAMQNFVDELEKSTIEAWIRVDDGYLEKILVSVPDFSYGAVAFKTDVTIEFKDFNTADLQKPTAAIPFDEELKNIIAGSLGSADVKSRDARRTAEIRQIQLALELYFDEHGSYPSNLKLLVPKFMDHVPTDVSDATPYVYTPHIANGMYTGYHLGASLEDKNHTSLQSDADCNSKTGVHCASYKNSFIKSGSFDGSDVKGCRAEVNRYCFDLVP
ncbi:MAG: hypothetical protein A2756_06565 [Candidatus Ryanbacteria bacterium RIFCSPHIGHO2_01_FULL_48_27]|uniref:Uncharacterized protein n=1 Tax=Candidatus Ryanbacteria bacterium RIFCSPHIGHO2_01_FULL_48_27 TaxID=1802115 RepID=A0A1G2G827_9BACT|nr:MAG: hypothetical protein A2756_06565 [Candidatus Ryanbacteria bacterium RIFCSPHIGHO2_01_FULL_48_27]